MKKIFILLFSLLLLVGCQNAPVNTNSEMPVVNVPTNNNSAIPEFNCSNPCIWAGYRADVCGSSHKCCDNLVERNGICETLHPDVGKPVIYLYPEKETDVLVKVSPKGGMTDSNPSYNNGWLVKASPNGDLYNYADKKVYPYLYWHGKGADYLMPEKGFVVAKENIDKFLEEKLSLFGLIPKEYNEFINFWLPKMQAKPYYFITFLPQSESDIMAPLEISPKPDTILRVFMDFKGLDSPNTVEPQQIQKTERNGFTVIEWGGILHD